MEDRYLRIFTEAAKGDGPMPLEYHRDPAAKKAWQWGVYLRVVGTLPDDLFSRGKRR